MRGCKMESLKNVEEDVVNELRRKSVLVERGSLGSLMFKIPGPI